MLKLVVLLLAGLASTNADWYEDPTWAFNSYIGDSIDLICNDTDLNLEATVADMVKWRTPGGKDIEIGDKYDLSNTGSISHMTLTVKDVQDGDKGVYHCFVYLNSKLRTQTIRGLNLYEPKYKDYMDKYWYNIMIGGIAAAALFIPLVAFCALYKFRYKTEVDRSASRYQMQKRKQVHTSSAEEAGELPFKVTPGGKSNEGFSTNL